jgi:hypothetical protein
VRNPVCSYIDSPLSRYPPSAERAQFQDDSASGPFIFDPFRAVRFAKAGGKKAAARAILSELRAFEEALALSDTYTQGLSAIEEVQSPCPLCRQSIASIK